MDARSILDECAHDAIRPDDGNLRTRTIGDLCHGSIIGGDKISGAGMPLCVYEDSTRSRILWGIDRLSAKDNVCPNQGMVVLVQSGDKVLNSDRGGEGGGRDMGRTGEYQHEMGARGEELEKRRGPFRACAVLHQQAEAWGIRCPITSLEGPACRKVVFAIWVVHLIPCAPTRRSAMIHNDVAPAIVDPELLELRASSESRRVDFGNCDIRSPRSYVRKGRGVNARGDV